MKHLNMCICIRDGFKTQPPVDRRFRPVPPGFYCSKQWQPPGTGRNRRSTGGWVLKPPLSWYQFQRVDWKFFPFINTLYIHLDHWRHYGWYTGIYTCIYMFLFALHIVLTLTPQNSVRYKVTFTPPNETRLGFTIYSWETSSSAKIFFIPYIIMSI